MPSFTLYDENTAPESTKQTLAQIKQEYGIIPNIYGYLAESPVALNAFLDINDQLMEHSSLTPAQVQIALLAISQANNCSYCMAAHNWAGTQVHSNPLTVKAILEGKPIEDPKDKIFVDVARSIVKDRGHLSDALIDEFLDAGYTKQNLFDLLVCNMLKTLSNYSNHITKTEINKELSRATISRATK